MFNNMFPMYITKKKWVPMNFHGTKKLFQMVSHDRWARNRKIVISVSFEILGWVNAWFNCRINFICELQSTPDNSNLQGKSKKGLSYREFELSEVRRK